MQHLFSYALSDFLLFSPETYFRLFERMNEALWPLQMLLFGGVLLVLWLALKQRALRLLAVVFAVAWLLVAWVFFWDRYQSINWAGSSFAAAAVLQALLLLQFAVWPAGYSQRSQRPALLLLAFALLIQPLIVPLSGRSWQGVELFGLAPDPTAAASVAFVLLLSGWRRWLVMPLALLWCAISAATAWAMEWPAGLIGPAVAVAVLLLGVPLQKRYRRETPPRNEH
ncbi:MAG: DUF6064 family protein [Kiloniellales bacterium]